MLDEEFEMHTPCWHLRSERKKGYTYVSIVYVCGVFISWSVCLCTRAYAHAQATPTVTYIFKIKPNVACARVWKISYSLWKDEGVWIWVFGYTPPRPNIKRWGQCGVDQSRY